MEVSNGVQDVVKATKNTFSSITGKIKSQVRKKFKKVKFDVVEGSHFDSQYSPTFFH